MSRAEQQLPEEGPVNQELQRTSPERWGKMGSLAPELGQVQQGQGRPSKQEESMEVSRTQLQPGWVSSWGRTRGVVKNWRSRET